MDAKRATKCGGNKERIKTGGRDEKKEGKKYETRRERKEKRRDICGEERE